MTSTSPASYLPLPSVTLHLSLLCLPLLLKTSPLWWECWQGFLTRMQPEGSWCVPGRAGASRHVMAPQPLLLTESTGVPDVERELKRSKEALQKNSWTVIAAVLIVELWCVLVKTEVLSEQVVPLLIAAVSPDCHRSAAGGTRGRGGAYIPTMQPPEPCIRGNSEAILMRNKWFILCKNLWLSEGDGKLCLRGLSARGQQEDMIIEWLHHTFLNIQCETGRYGTREGRQRSRTGEMWQNQGMCEKGGNQAVGRYLGHTGFF